MMRKQILEPWNVILLLGSRLVIHSRQTAFWQILYTWSTTLGSWRLKMSEEKNRENDLRCSITNHPCMSGHGHFIFMVAFASVTAVRFLLAFLFARWPVFLLQGGWQGLGRWFQEVVWWCGSCWSYFMAWSHASKFLFPLSPNLHISLAMDPFVDFLLIFKSTLR